MHCVVSWDIKVEKPRWDELNEALKKQLEGYAWVKPLTTLYVVRVHSTDDWNRLKERLVTVCRNNPKTIHFIMSPPMTGGSYNGWLPNDLWDKIRERTQ